MSTLRRHIIDSLQAIDAQGLPCAFGDWHDGEVNDLLNELLTRLDMDDFEVAKYEFMSSFFDASSGWKLSDLMSRPNLINETMVETLKSDSDVCRWIGDWLAEFSLIKDVS